MITCSIDKAKLRKLKQQLEALGKSTATKILVDELKTTAKATLVHVKSVTPKDQGKLRRSAAMKRVKKRRRYSVAFRIFFRALKDRKFYGFAPEYGVTKGRGKQPAQGMIQTKGKAFAEGLVSATYARIKARIKAAWNKAK